MWTSSRGDYERGSYLEVETAGLGYDVDITYGAPEK